MEELINKINNFNCKDIEERKNLDNIVLSDREKNMVKFCNSENTPFKCYKIKTIDQFKQGKNQCKECIKKRVKNNKSLSSEVSKSCHLTLSIKKKSKLYKRKISQANKILEKIELDDFDSIMENNYLFYVGKLKILKKLLSS